MTLKKNIHPTERMIRAILGLVLIALYFLGNKNPWFLVGIVPLLTALVGWCPPYQLLGINTCRYKKNS